MTSWDSNSSGVLRTGLFRETFANSATVEGRQNSIRHPSGDRMCRRRCDVVRVRSSSKISERQMRLFTPDVVETASSQHGFHSSQLGLGVRIDRVMHHALDNQAATPTLTNIEAILKDDQYELFASYVESALVRADWLAHFEDENAPVPSLCRRILGHEVDFIEASRQLAELLFQQMRPRPRNIAPGDFVAMIVTREDTGNQCLALLKLEMDSRVARNFTSEGPYSRVTYGSATNLMPESGHLQKCAVISPSASRGGLDVTLLDNQHGPGADSVATFFFRGFLTTTLYPSSRRLTRNFLNLTERWLRIHEKELQPTAIASFYRSRRQHLECDNRNDLVLDVAKFAADALSDQFDLRVDLQDFVSQNLSERDDGIAIERFPINRTVAEKFLSSIVLILDGGARIRIPARHYDELIKVDAMRTSDNRFHLSLETHIFREDVS